MKEISRFHSLEFVTVETPCLKLNDHNKLTVIDGYY